MKAKWNERYQGAAFYYGQVPNDFIKEVAGTIAPHSKVLCLAEGEGRNAVYLAKLGHQVVAVDQSEIGLEKLQAFAETNQVQVKTILADLNNYHIEQNHWDAIVSIWCHLPSPLRKKVHAECVSGLKTNGLFILESYTPQQIILKTGGPDNPDLLMTAECVRLELLGLSFLLRQEIQREIHEGQGHDGMSAVVQVLAKKCIGDFK
ncbi:MAG: hypothetical protein A2X86_12715 [Bdellovibrionales bacterium GWA2_49_15]|nr:MAG: hypothetical protein A2X86_12715 [Bdellovibrionales bacterium GWA2_49_15]HAZ14715.1 SAM-dependent methyltransferase [Bdellovibrionales bacterium]